jgi:uncharacterized membrane protein SpoIIM required for sporulation/uncharacterized RDD family membrane protein YckC
MTARAPLIPATSARPAADPFDLMLQVETPEQIAFSYSVAGIGSRAAAALLDMLIFGGVLTVITLALFFISISVVGRKHGTATEAAWFFAIYLLIQFAVFWGYYVFFEGLWDGQTPGKRLMRLRVVRDGGYSVTFGASAVRNLVRFVDMLPLPPLYLVGLVSAAFSPARKRLGDIAAGTFVVKETRAEPVAATRASSGAERTPMVTARLSDDEYAVLELYAQRRAQLDVERRRTIAAQLGTRFASHMDAAGRTAPAAGLIRLYEMEREARASGVAGRSDTGARREQHAIVALGLKRWNDFARALDEAQRTGLRHMKPEEVSDLVAQYREITTDLARLQTAARGRSSDALFYLSRLVARGHNLLYGAERQSARSTARYVTRTVPREVRRSWRQIALAAALLFGPAIASFAAVVHDPGVAERLLPDEMLSRANTGAEREKRGEGYVTISEMERPVMASAIISNNVQVTYVTFAMGITAGIGTVFLLVMNGVSIGAAVGLFASRHIAHLILAFIAPHGVLELSAICIAAGGGLLIAQGILIPGARTRREAIVENGKRAIALIACSTLLLICAGTLEGLVSPRVMPMAWKLAISATTAVALAAYLSLGRGGEEAAEPEHVTARIAA